jgi:23S rRNA (adenine2030-N6)-methyltransferase
MNYRHIYHAGNFADVFKHAVLARLLRYLQSKDKAFRVLDTHAGIGVYDLSSEEAQKTGEWLDGIGRIMAADLPAQAAELLEPYLSTPCRRLIPKAGMQFYPGSPKLARLLLRPQDRLSAMELHPEDCNRLHRLFEGDHQVRVTELDGWLALERASAAEGKTRHGAGRSAVRDRGRIPTVWWKGWPRHMAAFPGGVYCLWYPLKNGCADQANSIPALQAISKSRKCCAPNSSVRSERDFNRAFRLGPRSSSIRRIR